MDRANRLQAEGIFLGGPTQVFEAAGRNLLMTLLSEGLTPNSKVLDIGCGCLRGGYWLIHFLDEGRYFGIEPNISMLEAGIRILLEPGLADLKKPSFDYNTDFDFTVFKEKFDFLVARSIWTHASKQQIQTMLDGFATVANAGGVFLTSYIPATLFKRDYKGDKWVGKSHQSDAPGLVTHSLSWIQTECVKRGLVGEEIKEKTFNFGDQTWIKITRKAG
jgi:cyclopropane fatty-acyl-phospholipid synthase-like methyltransferase